MRTAQVFASAVPLAVLELWATAAVAWDAALVGRASPNVLLTRRPGTEETLHGFWTPGYECVAVDKAVIARCDALLVMAALDGDGLDGLDGLAPVANALKIDCAVSAVPLSAASVTHLLTEAPATWATVGNTHRKLQICSLSQSLEPSGSSSCPRNGCLASAGYALSPQAPAWGRLESQPGLEAYQSPLGRMADDQRRHGCKAKQGWPCLQLSAVATEHVHLDDSELGLSPGPPLAAARRSRRHSYGHPAPTQLVVYPPAIL